jgi:hypothetical protein
MNRRLNIFALFIFLSLPFSGCVTAIRPVTISTLSNTPVSIMETFTPVLISTATPVVSITPSLISTKRPSPSDTSPTLPTLGSGSTETPTPLPTLSKSEALDMAKAVFSDQICKLPCWARIVPGVTRWREIRPYIQTFARVNEHNYTDVEISVPNPFASIKYDNLAMAVYLEPTGTPQDQIVQWIQTYRLNYPISEMLAVYGPPSEIWYHMDVKLAPFEGSLIWYELILFYPSKGFVAIYNGDTQFDLKKIRICPSQVYVNQLDPFLKLWSPNKQMTFKELTTTSFWEYSSFESYTRLDSSTGITPQEFYDTYKTSMNANKCIVVDNTILGSPVTP